MALQLPSHQRQQLAENMFLGRLDRALCRSVPDVAELGSDLRGEFLRACMDAAYALNLRTEQGLASYALAAWFLDVGFEQQSRHLIALLASGFPEVRKVHAMNEWARTVIGQPQDMAVADEVLKQAFYSTSAQGGQNTGSN